MTTLERSQHSLIARLSADERVAGYYRYAAHAHRRQHDGHTVWRIQLADRSGAIDTYASRTLSTPFELPPTHQLAYAEFRTYLYQGRLLAQLLELDTLMEPPGTEAVVDRLPRTATRYPTAMDGLAELLNGLSVPALRHFVDRVLAQDALALAWVGDDTNGFLQAVVAAEVASQMPYFHAQERDLIVVGALLRHLGAVHLPGTPRTHREVPIGTLTIERCATGLQWLAQAWPYGAGCLRQILAGEDTGAEPSLNSVLGHAVSLVTQIAKGDMSGAAWLATQRTWSQ